VSILEVQVNTAMITSYYSEHLNKINHKQWLCFSVQWCTKCAV